METQFPRNPSCWLLWYWDLLQLFSPELHRLFPESAFFQLLMDSDFDLLFTPDLYSFPCLYKLCILALLITLLSIHNNSGIYPCPWHCSWAAVLRKTAALRFYHDLTQIHVLHSMNYPLPCICHCQWCKNMSFHSFNPSFQLTLNGCSVFKIFQISLYFRCPPHFHLCYPLLSTQYL